MIIFFFTLQYCIGFAYINIHTPRVYILNSPPTSLPIPSLWVIPVHQPQGSCILHQTWTGDSFLIWYYTCFNAILPNHPPSLSHRVQKTVLYICVSFAVSHTGLLLPSFYLFGDLGRLVPLNLLMCSEVIQIFFHVKCLFKYFTQFNLGYLSFH